MTITSTPASARTDESVAGRPTLSARAVRRTGWAVAGGALIWAGVTAAINPQSTGNLDILLSDVGALPFQLSLFALVTTQLRTGATGTTRVARGMLRAEYGLLTLATLWTVLHALLPSARDAVWMHVLDAFWPLSMLGMFVIAVKIAFAGRWTGVLRAWPLVAESWAVVTVPAFGAFGAVVGQYVGVAHLLVGYTVLGVLLATRPHLTGAR
jgi:hypothetical protein